MTGLTKLLHKQNTIGAATQRNKCPFEKPHQQLFTKSKIEGERENKSVYAILCRCG